MWWTTGHNQPDFRLTVDGLDVTARLQKRLVSLSLVDNRGLEADELTVDLSDHDGKLPIPPLGGKARLWLGWKGQALVDKGTFVLDEASWSGMPGQLSIMARSANLRDKLNIKKERSWHEKTVDDIVETIAGEAGIAAKVCPELAGHFVRHKDQTNESDAAFLTRLAKEVDAIATVKADTLLFFRPGQGATVGGAPLGGVTIRLQDGDSPRYRIANRDAYNGVKASWQDKKKGKKKCVTIKKGDCDESDPAEGSPENLRVLRHVYASEEEAREAALAEWKRIQRGKAAFDITLALGRPDLCPETPVRVAGVKPQIDATDWLLVRVTHSLSDGGYTSSLEMEIRDGGEAEEIE